MSSSGVNVDGFRAFESAGWSTRADAYHRFFNPVSEHLVSALLDAAQITQGTRLLDLATGPGYAAAEAAARGALSVGIDSSADMVRLAASLHPECAFHQASAEALPFAEDAFDAVVGNLLLMHLAEPERAVTQAYRVLAPGGVMAFTVWDVPSRCRLMGVLAEAAQAVGVQTPPTIPVGPPVFRFADDAAFTALLEGTGLGDVVIQSVNFTRTLPDVETYWNGMLQGTVRTAALVNSQPAAVQQRIHAEVERLLAPYVTDAGVVVPVAAKLAVGRRPA